jgi:hypothetical protein
MDLQIAHSGSNLGLIAVMNFNYRRRLKSKPSWVKAFFCKINILFLAQLSFTHELFFFLPSLSMWANNLLCGGEIIQKMRCKNGATRKLKCTKPKRYNMRAPRFEPGSSQEIKTALTTELQIG